MHDRWSYLGLPLLFVCTACVLAAQARDSQGTYTHTGPLATASEILAEHGIINREQTVRALTAAEPMLRSVAALRLADEKDPEAVQLIESALEREQNSVVIVNFASTLWSLGEPRGQGRLEDFCQSLKTPTDILVRSAEQLSLRHKGGVCARALVSGYHNAFSAWQKLQIVHLLQAVAGDVKPEDKPDTIAMANEASQSPDLEVRVEARRLRRLLQ